jgi:hypothetical protein
MWLFWKESTFLRYLVFGVRDGPWLRDVESWLQGV